MTTALARPLQGLAAARSPGSRVPALVLSVVAGIYLVLFEIAIDSGFAPDLMRDVVNHVPTVVALTLGLLRVRRSHGRERRAWIMLTLGVGCWFIADLGSTYYSFILDRDIPFPSLVEPIYYAGYLFLPAGFLLLSNATFRRLQAHAYVDLAMLGLSITVLTWQFLLQPVATQDLGTAALLAATAYPALDILVLLVVAAVFYYEGERSSLRFTVFACVIGLSIAADSLYAADIDESGMYSSAIDTLFVAVYWLLAVAFVVPGPQSELERDTFPNQRSIAGVYLPRFLAVMVVVVCIYRCPPITEDLTVMHIGAIAGLALLILRQNLTTRENTALIARMQRTYQERTVLLRALGDLGEAFATVKDGRFVTSNHAIWLLFGYRQEELSGTLVSSHLVERDRPRLQGIMQRAEESDAIVAGTEVTIIAKDGREVVLEVTVKPVVNDSGRQLLLVARDITERKLTQRAVLENQKLEGLRVLAGGVAHDFNNLLQVIRGYAHLATLETGGNSGVEPYLLDIELAAERAAGLARQMLIYAGKADPVTETIAPGRVVEEMALLLRASVGEDVVLDVHIDDGVPETVGDASQLRQVVMNLVVNASEAIGDHPGRITVRTSHRYLSARELADAHAASDVPPGQFICIEVADNGPGMAEEIRRRIFDPFYSTKFAGRGLGLAAVSGIVRAHGGAISVVSSPGKGAVFSVSLPAHLPGSEVAS